MKNQSLGDRMKSYEQLFKLNMTPRMYNVMRLDGRAFHTFTKNFKRPFDEQFIKAMDMAAIAVCKEIQGARFAYVQSDEISVLFTSFSETTDIKTAQSYFDGDFQKTLCIPTSKCSSTFNFAINEYMISLGLRDKNTDLGFDEIRNLADFDNRIIPFPDEIEVSNYFIWRQQDFARNSVQSVASSLYSHKELENKNTKVMQEMCFQKGVNWNDLEPKYKCGRLIVKENYFVGDVQKSRWVSIAAPHFTQDRQKLMDLIPKRF